MFVSSYDDFTIVTKTIREGADAFVITENEELGNAALKGHLCRIEKVLYRSSDPKSYDSAGELCGLYRGSYDYSGEFVTDNDSVYVWLKELDSI